MNNTVGGFYPVNYKRSFYTNNENRTQNSEKADNKNTKKKVAMVIGGLAALAVAGVGLTYAVKKHKLPSSVDMNEFKLSGKFEKGIAKFKGKNYTGVINHTGKNWEQFALTYENGKITKSVKTLLGENGETKETLEKTYKYFDRGSKSVSTVLSDASGAKTVSRVHINPDKTSTVMKNGKTIKTVLNSDGSYTSTVGKFEKDKGRYVIRNIIDGSEVIKPQGNVTKK